MDILYSLGEGSKWNNNELKYSLRSIAKFGKNVKNIYVVGYNPGFLSDKVIFISKENLYDSKHKNILDAIVYAVDNCNIDNEFLYSSDDHFYIKETDFDNYPYFVKGQLISKIIQSPKMRRKIKSRSYFKSLIDTRNCLLNEHFTTYDFSWHGNTHLSREGIEKARLLIQKSFVESKYGYEPTCLILNTIYSSVNKFPIVFRNDLKIGNISSIDDLINKIGNRECFSISDRVIGKGISEYLYHLFPEKCIYEK